MIAVTERSVVGEIEGKKIYNITAAKLFPVSKSNKENIEEEVRKREIFFFARQNEFIFFGFAV